MAAGGPVAELLHLKRFRNEAQTQFLAPHLASPSLGVPSRQEELAVAAFVVLLHGAVENFAEGLCLWIAHRVEQSWLSKRRLSKATAAILLHTSVPVPRGPPDSFFDSVRLALSQALTDISGRVAQNHGVAQKDLRALLEPVGLTVNGDPLKIASLDLLVSIRHQWAHQYRFGAKKVKSAADIVVVADDCVQIAEELTHAAVALRS